MGLQMTSYRHALHLDREPEADDMDNPELLVAPWFPQFPLALEGLSPVPGPLSTPMHYTLFSVNPNDVGAEVDIDYRDYSSLCDVLPVFSDHDEVADMAETDPFGTFCHTIGFEGTFSTPACVRLAAEFAENRDEFTPYFPSLVAAYDAAASVFSDAASNEGIVLFH